MRKAVMTFVAAVTVVLLSAVGAWASTEYDFIQKQSWLSPQPAPVDLGSLVIRIDPLTAGEHKALFILPGGFELQAPGDVAALEDGDVQLNTTKVGDNEFLGVITAPKMTGKCTFVLPLKSTVPDGLQGDVELRVMSIEGQLRDGAVVIGSGRSGQITIETRRVADFDGGKATVEIALSENKARLLRKGSPVKLTLPEGFAWTRAEGTVVSGEGLTVTPVTDGRVLEIRVDTESTKRAELVVRAELEIDAERAAPGDVRAEISGLSNLSARTILVGHYETPAAEPEPEPEPEPREERTVVFTIGAGKYNVNGTLVQMDTVPYVKDGRTFLPLRYIGLSLGVDEKNIEWDGKTATLTKGDRVVKVAVNVKSVNVNGQERAIDAAPEIAPPGRIMLPYRAVAEAFGAKADWDAATKTVTMKL